MVLARLAVGVLAARALWGQGVIQTIAGTDWIFPDNGRPAVGAALGPPEGLALDSQGNLYIADTGNYMVLRVDRNGIVTVFAGTGIPGYSGDDGPATSASMRLPTRVAVDSQDNVYITDYPDFIRKVSPDGVIRRFAGRPQAPLGDGGPALEAGLGGVRGLAVDSAGNLFVAVNAQRVRKIDTRGIITTVAGNGTPGFSGDGGPATQASLLDPWAVAVGPDGSLYVAELHGRRIRRVSPDGIISTFAGNGEDGPSGSGGPATAARISLAWDVITDAAGNVYFTASGRIWRVDLQGIVRDLTGFGLLSGIAAGLARDSGGNFYVSESSNRRVARFTASGGVSTFAGDGNFRVSIEGAPAVESFLFEPQGVFSDSTGSLLIADIRSNRVRRLGPDGTLTTIASVNSPWKAIVDPAGNILIASPGVVRRLEPDGRLTAIAGRGVFGYGGDGGPATEATLEHNLDIATDRAGNLYIADEKNNRVRRVGPDGIITTVAGNGTTVSSGDGGPAVNAGVHIPRGVAVDSAGNLYIAAGRIRKVSTSGVISTLAFFNGQDVAVDAAGNLYVVAWQQRRVFVLSPAGVVRNTIGRGEEGFRGDGGPASEAVFNDPQGVAVNSSGRIYIADTGNSRIRLVETLRPSFQLSAPRLDFTVSSGGQPPPSQSFDVTSATVGLPITVRASTASGGPWLTVTPASGAAPTRIRVGVNPAGLAAGTYQGTVTVTAPDASPPAQTVTVQVLVEPPPPPAPSVEPSGLTFSFLQGANPASQQLRVSNLGSGSLSFTATAVTTSGGSWLSVTPGGGAATPAAPAVLNVTANAERLLAGTYSGRVIITPAGVNPIDVPVSMTVTATPQRILLSQTGLTFTAVAGGGVPLPQNFLVLNSGSGILNWTAAASTLSGGSQWLSLSPDGGTSDASTIPAPVEVRVNPVGLAPGEYYGQIEVRGIAANSPQSLLVVLNVLPVGQNPGPVVQPAGFVFTGVAGGSSPGSQTLLVSNLTSQPLSFNSGQVTLDGANWFVRVPPNGSVRPEAPFRIIVQPDTTGLAAGVYSGVLTLVFADRSVRTVTLLLVVAPASGGARLVQQTACTPSRLLPVFTSLGQDFNVSAAWPVPIEARIVNDCGAPLTSGAVVTTFSNGDPPLAMTSLRDGRWSGTWAPRNIRTAQTTVTLNAEAPPTLRGTATATGSLLPNANPPLVASGGVVSAASYERRGPISPGAIVSIFGSRLSDGTSLADRLPLDLRRMGTEVVLAGRPLPIYYTSEGQVNAMVPFGLEVNTSHQLIVRRGNTLSVPEAVTVAMAQPAVFTVNGLGTGQGHIYRQTAAGELILAAAGNPVTAGDAVVIYCAGLGPVIPVVDAGQAAPRSPLAETANPVTVTIGGRQARVLFAGLAPDLTGLYQINAEVPAGLSGGSDVPVVLMVAGQAGPAVTMAVR